ncbi:hypothetical protein C882_3447 [Caenispirillum salinarum AK4]|uniref:Ribonuclease VapC n=1 Tax=Caenispirillum salinarum AK4 TaxID=1238182 RepID=K9H2B3_9PROT|nr:type II toxin-antitoxin system VapC family toxin [Caenispirillum salinarum]EKV31697.1 hypothetical protein C882_3447 [Caenispirillum salinarum AK4]
MTLIVVDASVAVKWVVTEEPVEETAAARLLTRRARLAAPRLLDAELGNILWRKRRKGELTADEAEEAAIVLENAPLERGAEAGLWLRALALAAEMDHPVYDCVYVALAERLQAAFVVTADRRFAQRFASGSAPHTEGAPLVIMVGDAGARLDALQE